MISAPGDVKKFNRMPRVCRYCGKPINRPEDAEMIQDKHRDIWYIHTGCAAWIQEVKRSGKSVHR